MDKDNKPEGQWGTMAHSDHHNLPLLPITNTSTTHPQKLMMTISPCHHHHQTKKRPRDVRCWLLLTISMCFFFLNIFFLLMIFLPTYFSYWWQWQDGFATIITTTSTSTSTSNTSIMPLPPPPHQRVPQPQNDDDGHHNQIDASTHISMCPAAPKWWQCIRKRGLYPGMPWDALSALARDWLHVWVWNFVGSYKIIFWNYVSKNVMLI